MNVARDLRLAAACLLLAGCAGGPARRTAHRPEPPLVIGDAPQADARQDDSPHTDAPQDDAALVAAHNQIRARRGLPPLEPSPALSAAAARHARDMASRQRMRHRGSDGTTPFQRMSQEGYEFRAAAENIAYGQPTVDAVMDAWWRSLPHRANMLGKFSQIGTGVATAEDGTLYWCVTFGKPADADSAPGHESLGYDWLEGQMNLATRFHRPGRTGASCVQDTSRHGI